MNKAMDRVGDYRRVRYIGDHPHIKGLDGDSYFEEKHNCDLFRPDAEDGHNSLWYRVWAENLINLEATNEQN